jgi:hypothetical protein
MNEAIQSLKAPERSHDNGDPHGWPQLSASEPFMRDLFLSQFLNSLLVRAKLLKQCVDLGSAEENFSRLLYIQQYSKTLSYDELVVTPDIVAIIVRGSVGICGAALLYFFLHAGIIEGPFIPDFSKFAMQLTPETPAQYPRLLMVNNQLALLIVWSFLAGFSERLVPSVLATTESKLGNGARPTPQPGLR